MSFNLNPIPDQRNHNTISLTSFLINRTGKFTENTGVNFGIERGVMLYRKEFVHP